MSRPSALTTANKFAANDDYSLCHLPADYFPNTSSPYPTVFLVRHGESEYNHMHSLYMQYSSSTATSTSVSFSSHPSLSADDEPDIVCPDAPLTALGHKQAAALRQQLAAYTRRYTTDGFGIDVLIASPLTRALQTCLIAMADFHQQYYPPQPPPPKKRKATTKQKQQQRSNDDDYVQVAPIPVILHPDVAEHCYCMSDVGRPLSVLLPLFSHFEFDTAPFEGREERWWYGANGRNGDVWTVMHNEYPDITQRTLLLEIAKADDPDDDADEDVEVEKQHHSHTVNVDTATHNSPKHSNPSRHAHTSPAHIPHSSHSDSTHSSSNGSTQHSDTDTAAAASVASDKQHVRLHPQLVDCEGEGRLAERLGDFLCWLVARYATGVRVCVVCHSQVIATLGQGWLQNGEMVQMDWDAVPQRIMKKVKVKAGMDRKR